MAALSFTIPFKIIPDFDMDAKISGGFEKASMTVFAPNDEDAYTDPDRKGWRLYETPCIVFREYDPDMSESAGCILMKDVGDSLTISKEQYDFLKKYADKDFGQEETYELTDKTFNSDEFDDNIGDYKEGDGDDSK